MNEKLKVLALFSLVFLLLAAWTVKISINKEQETELVMAVSAEPVSSDYFVEQYRPYSPAELSELLDRIDGTTIQYGEIVVITRKPTLYQLAVSVVDDDYSNIWVPDCLEIRRLILRHDILFQEYQAAANVSVNIIIDNGVVYSKPMDVVAKQFNAAEVVAKCGNLRHRDFGSIGGSHMHGGY